MLRIMDIPRHSKYFRYHISPDRRSPFVPTDLTLLSNKSSRIRAASHKEAGQADIIVITAGAAQKKGESRTDLIGRNLKILSSVIEDMKPFKESAILILVANPVDVLVSFFSIGEAVKALSAPLSKSFASVESVEC